MTQVKEFDVTIESANGGAKILAFHHRTGRLRLLQSIPRWQVDTSEAIRIRRDWEDFLNG